MAAKRKQLQKDLEAKILNSKQNYLNSHQKLMPNQAETKPACWKPTETKPAEAKPAETKPA